MKQPADTELDAFFGGLQPSLEIAEKAQAELDRRTATRFSVFDYFYEREEDLSRVFAGLMDPQGGHGQGDRFLRAFLDELKEHWPTGSAELLHSQLSERVGQCKVYKEHPVWCRRAKCQGRVDIVLEFPDNLWVGIENKPWAGEQEHQCADYLDALLQRDARSLLLFASGQGQDPTSICDKHPQRNRCVTISYVPAQDMPSLDGWLERCSRVCDAERVRWFLTDVRQYIASTFSTQPTGRSPMATEGNLTLQAAQDYIRTPKHLELAATVAEALDAVTKKTVDDTLDAIAKTLRESPPPGWRVARHEGNTKGHANRVRLYRPEGGHWSEDEERWKGIFVGRWNYDFESPFELMAQNVPDELHSDACFTSAVKAKVNTDALMWQLPHRRISELGDDESISRFVQKTAQRMRELATKLDELDGRPPPDADTAS